MRRFRLRRRRAIAVALATVSALTTMILTSALAAPGTSARTAQIDASSRTVPVGKPVTLRGTFPGAANARLDVRYRAAGSQSWVTAAHTTTGAAGRYSAQVQPRRSGYWRAELATPAVRDAQVVTESPRALDAGTDSERIAVRPRTRT